MFNLDDLILDYVGWTVCSPQWSWQRTETSMQCYDFWYIVDGEGGISDGQHQWSLRSGDILLYPPGKSLSGWHDQQRRLIVGFVHFRISGQHPLKEWLATPGGITQVHTNDPDFMAGIMRRFFLLHESEGPSINCKHLFVSSLIETNRIRQFYGYTGSPIERRTGLEGLCQKIRAQPEDTWLVDDMADMLGVSVSYFTKMFKSAKGVSPKRFVIESRITQAKSLLLLSDLNITHIAKRLGYADVFTFSKQFQKETGKSPSEWRTGSQLR